jgi:non-heme chloroperoxidase
MSYVKTADGTDIYYDDWGDGPPVVFVPAAYLNSQMWEYQRPALVREGLRCIAYDRRGHGRSARPWNGYDYDTLADDLAAVLNFLDLRDVTLVGYSMGSGEVIRYLSRHGSGRVARVVVVAATAPFLGRAHDNPDGVPQEIVRAAIERIRVDRAMWFADNAEPFFAGAASPELTRWGVRMCLDSTPQSTMDCLEAVSTTDFRSELAAITVPALIIHGDADISAPVHLCGRRIAGIVPNARYIEYAGAPHGLFATHADRLNGDLLDFLRAGPVGVGRRADRAVASVHTS